jgi:spermidine/putrescine transport system substrate-binding protein
MINSATAFPLVINYIKESSMRKIILLGLAAVLLLSAFGCKPAQKKLYIYNWTIYTPEEVIKAFESQYGVKVVYDEFASNEEMFTKLKAGASGYDITFPSGDYVSIMIKENMLDKIDKSRLPNFKNIDPEIIKDIKFDPDNEYSVPYMKGASGIAVNKKEVKDYKRDLSILLKPELKGRITLLDDMREVLGYALAENGFSVNTTNSSELEKAKELVLKWKVNLQKFDSDTYGQAFAKGDFWVVQTYEENVFTILDENMKNDVDFFIPEKGPMYMDSMVILKDSKNKELAYEFINFIHEPAQYAKFVDMFEFPCMNMPARELRKSKPRYDYADIKNCEYKEDLGKNLDLYNKVWQDIRIGD